MTPAPLTSILEVCRGLIPARNVSHAVAHGGLRRVPADDDVPVFLPENAEQTALIQRARAVHDPIQGSTGRLTGVADAQTAYGQDLILSGDSVALMADSPEVNIRTWPKG